MTKPAKLYDLEERTGCLGEAIIAFCVTAPQTFITRPFLEQLIRSGTSIGANYMEANGASSKRDFRNKIHIVKKECQETKHWLRMLAAAIPDKKVELRVLWQEAQELTLIFQKIANSLREKKEDR